MRVACLYLPDLPLAAALRVEPELLEHPLGIADGNTLVAGRLRGLTLAQARAIEPDLVVRPLGLESLRSTQEALLDVASSISPRVEDAAPGLAYVDLDGTGALFPTERGLLTALETRAHDVGLATVQLGLGPSRSAAALAARHDGGGAIVRDGELATFLNPLPLDLLDPPEEILDRLTRWGVRTLGELSRLPRHALGARLGEDGVLLARRARGEDLTPFRSVLPPLRFEESIDPGFPVADLETLAFPLRGVLERLTRRLRVRGLAVRELTLELTLESGRRFERNVQLGASTLETPVLLALIRLSLEKSPPDAPIEGIRVIAAPGSVETAQLDLFLPPLPAPAELAITVARLEALCGSENVGAPACHDTHRLDQAHLELFRARAQLAPAHATVALPEPVLALRALRPPHAVRVWEQDGLPERVALGERALRVLERAGPWRLFGEWWGESRFARDYFDVELSDGGVYRLYHNLADESWFLDGVYD